MSGNRHINWICVLGAVLMVAVTILYLCFGGTVLTAAAREMPYVEKLFSADRVHTVDIVADENDWTEMLQNALQEEYIPCTVVIDGERAANVGIRPKGNTSLRSVASSDSDRYSFKLEFDRYETGKTWNGLDKLCLNNCIQDNTYMKDFLCCQMMNALGADAPLSSFAWVTVNGEDWGLYAAVEAVEDSFTQRVYGAEEGELYKPDSADMGGGGRGFEGRRDNAEADAAASGGFTPGEGLAPGENAAAEEGGPAGEKGWPGQMGNGALGGSAGDRAAGDKAGGMGSSDDVLLRYSDDDPESYPNIFDNAVLDGVTDSDKARLVRSLKALNAGDVEASVDVDEVLRYFAVHNFVLNEDSYTGSIIHNYYLHEQDGLLSMIAWDYNLAFGGMGNMGSRNGNGATSLVNSPIDSPVSSGDLSDRPMVSWIFENEEYTAQYHQVLDEFLTSYFESGYFEAMMDETAAMIAPYVEKDPTAFCTFEEFQKGAETLKEFCLLRAESVRKQLSGDIPSTQEGQTEDSSHFVDASALTVSDMGSQGGMGGEGMTPLEGFGDQAPGTQDGNTQNGAPQTGIPQNDGGSFGDGAMGSPQNGSSSAANWLWLGGSVLLLAAGLAFAKFYK